ncbi:hypothetical protein G3N95_12685 [Paraburkholderia sp. Tr-20389]|uniref:hypothetical protein n=1 Tax=Paraburkholderia sp. Tr-20389 TaxID=2703903 RepID=UPI001980AD82|nr:hypothetical protein [Paraburkholderia sp. Tr-20389]MBN3753800.1 hypothetical protein [Paraburkholderia sp. Tr-20389]
MAEIDYGEGVIVGKTLFFLKPEWDMTGARLSVSHIARAGCMPGKGLTHYSR